MQHQKLYSFSYLVWDNQYDPVTHINIPEAPCVKKRVTRGIMVTLESTRRGRQVFKTRDNWDSESETQFHPDNLPENPDSMKQCYYFWNCMRYSACLALADILDGGDACLKDGVDAYIEIKKLPIPKYGDDTIDYFKLFADLVPSVKLKRVENGY